MQRVDHGVLRDLGELGQRDEHAVDLDQHESADRRDVERPAPTAGPRRIELNALTSRQLVDLIERRLREHGIGKVVPDIDDLGETYRHYARAPKIKEAIEKAIADMPDDAVEVPADLEEQVKAYLEENPECPWEEAVAEIV